MIYDISCKINWKLTLPIVLLCFLRIVGPLDYLIYLAIIFCFMVADIKTSVLIYVCLLPWERMLAVSGVISLITIVQLLFVFKIIVYRYHVKTYLFEILLLFYFSIIGVNSFIHFTSVSSLMIPIEMAIIFFISKIIFDNRDMLHSVINVTVISLLVSLLYAVIHMNFAQRWVDGIGYVPLFRGVLESNETAFYCGLTLFLVCVLEIAFRKKIIIMFLISIALFATVSLTGIFLAIVAVTFAFIFDLLYFEKKGNRSTLSNKKKKILFLFIILFIILIILNMDIGEAIMMRIHNSFSQFISGDIDKATSGRENLVNIYLNVFDELPLSKKIFGTGLMGREYLISAGYNIQYPHNSFLELLFYEGILGLGLSFSFIIYRVLKLFQKNKTQFKILTVIKMLTIIEGMSVTMSGYAYWTFWYLI